MRRLVTENPIEVIRIFLKRLNIKITTETIIWLRNHPDFPNLFSISETLSRLGIDNRAIKSSYEQLQHELPKPLLVHLYSNGGLYLVVANVDNESIHFINEDNSLEAQPKEDFLKAWSGVALIANWKNATNEINFRTNYIKDTLQKSKFPIAIAFTLLFFLYSLIFTFPSNAFFYLYLLTKIAGVSVSVLLLMQSIDKDNPFVKKVCSSRKIGSKLNCNSILDSKAAHLFGIFSWTDIGFTYFYSLLVILLMSPDHKSLTLLSIGSLLALPYTFYSILYQWRVAKNWCALCLMVQGILIIEFVIGVIYLQGIESLDVLRSMDYYSLTLTLLFSILTFSFLKPIVSQYFQFKKQFPKLRKIKFNREVFNILLAKSKYIQMAEVKPLQIGQSSNTNSIITIISNPTCNPCIETHKKLLEIQTKNNKFIINEIFLTEEKNDDIGFLIAKKMIDIYTSQSKEIFEEAIHEYYLLKSTLKQEWLKKWSQIVEEDAESNNILSEHNKWCVQRGLLSTPVIMLNNRFLPDGYTYNDLEYLIE